MSELENQKEKIKSVLMASRDLCLLFALTAQSVENLPDPIKSKLDDLLTALLELDEAYSGG